MSHYAFVKVGERGWVRHGFCFATDFTTATILYCII